MKSQISSVDLHFLSREFQTLNSARIQKIYHLSEKTLRLDLYIPGKGSKEMIIAPEFIMLTGYRRKTPSEASSFAMQLRKHLTGGVIKGIEQHEFDRILEITIENNGKEYLLIVELFSKGNVILCNSDRRILGLLKWQKWKDRTLGVRKGYEYPPSGINSLNLSYEGFENLLQESENSAIAILARELSLGGLYAEEIFHSLEIDKEKRGCDLSKGEIKEIFKSLRNLIKSIKGEADPVVVIANNEIIDVIPFDLQVYEKLEKKKQGSFNDALDEYFSRMEFQSIETGREKKFKEELKRLKERGLKQEKTLQEMKENSEKYKKVGDVIYQNIHSIENLVKEINGEWDKGLDWSDIKKKFSGKKIGSLRVEEINKDSIVLSAE